MIRRGQTNEKASLEALQLRASMALGEYQDVLLARPDAISLPAHQIEKRNVLVATEGGQLTGFAAIEFREDGSAELDGLFVEPTRWREGIGTRLVKAAQRLAKSRGSKVLTVIANPTAQQFYERCEFSVTGMAQTRFGPAVLMTRRI